MASGKTSQRSRRRAGKTHFAPVERSDPEDLKKDIRILDSSPFVDGMMRVTGGLLAILNDQRQVLAFNEAFAESLGIEDPEAVFGLRPGEVLQCIYAQEAKGGCGTGRFCVTCGAAIAIMASLRSQRTEQRECVATLQRGGKTEDLYFIVHCSPITVEEKRYYLFFLQDVTVSQNRAALERMFFHDVKNMIGALTLNTHLMTSLPNEQDRQASQLRIQRIADYLDKEVEMQRVLTYNDAQGYCLEVKEVSVPELVQEMCDIAARHPAANGKDMNLAKSIPEKVVFTDVSLLRRVLLNMTINALEATRPGQTVKFWVEDRGKTVVFYVWNELPIPESIGLRVFQRNFSTKEGAGHGLGAYTMKLFGETYLGGQVRFTSSCEKGTLFEFEIPNERPVS